jgi:hypothetical protein
MSGSFLEDHFSSTYGGTNQQTGLTTYTLLPTDHSKLVTMNHTSPANVVCPPDLPVGFECKVTQLGAAVLTFTIGSGVTIVSNGATRAAPVTTQQDDTATVRCYATNVFLVHGDIA